MSRLDNVAPAVLPPVSYVLYAPGKNIGDKISPALRKSTAATVTLAVFAAGALPARRATGSDWLAPSYGFFAGAGARGGGVGGFPVGWALARGRAASELPRSDGPGRKDGRYRA